MFKVLASRVIIFTVATLWVSGWLLMGLTFAGPVTAALVISQCPSWLVLVLQIWYLITIVCVGVWAAMKGFRFVGKWEKHD